MNLSQSAFTCDTSIVPSPTPGPSARTIGSVLRQTSGIDRRFTQRTYALSTTSIGTRAGFKTRLVRNNRATGTLIDENPYPSAPFTVAARSVIPTSASVFGSMELTHRGQAVESLERLGI